MACVAPTETAADKLSALTWRVLSRQRGGGGNDEALIRHLHDLAALEVHAAEHPEFPEVTRRLLDTDVSRSRLPARFAEMVAGERVALALEVVATAPEYRSEYERFVTAMCYGNESDVPTFEGGLDAVGRLARILD